MHISYSVRFLSLSSSKENRVEILLIEVGLVIALKIPLTLHSCLSEKVLDMMVLFESVLPFGKRSIRFDIASRIN